MKNDIKNIKNELEKTNKKISAKEQAKILNDKLEFIILDELNGCFTSYFEDFDFNKATSLILENLEDIKKNIYQYILSYYEFEIIEKYNVNLELIKAKNKILIFKNLDYSSFSKIYDNVVFKELDKIKKNYKIKNVLKLKEEKENLEKEKEEVYIIIMNDFFEVMKKKKHRASNYKLILEYETRLKIWNNIDTFLTFEEYSKIYDRCLKEAKQLFGNDIKNNKQLKKWGLVALLVYISKHMKTPSKY